MKKFTGPDLLAGVVNVAIALLTTIGLWFGILACVIQLIYFAYSVGAGYRSGYRAGAMR